MRLKIQKLSSIIDKTTGETLQHTAPVSGVSWLNIDEVLSVGDDHRLLRWDTTSTKGQALQLTSASTSISNSIKAEFYPTCLQTSPRADNVSRSTTNATILMGTTEGKVYLLNKSGCVEKVVDAHKGAVFACRWSADALDFVTSGEDGAIKIWSKGGMLRSVLIQSGRPVYAMDWNASATKIVYCVGENCFVKPLKEQGGSLKWRAHNGVILCLVWSSKRGDGMSLLATGGEDCRYRVWDEMGRPIFSSDGYTFPITVLAWNPTGELLAVGAHNALRLCDCTGSSCSLERLSCGSLYSLAWSTDGTQLVAGCADGTLLHAHVLERRIIWENLEAIQTKQKTIEMRDVTSVLSNEKLETRDRIAKFSLGYGYLIVATTRQCYIYSSKTWNTPVIVELKGESTGGTSTVLNSVSLIILAEKCFLLADGGANILHVFNYEGRMQSQVRLTSGGIGSVAALSSSTAVGNTGAIDDIGETLNDCHVALSNDTLIVRDSMQRNVIRFFNTATGGAIGDRQFVHACEITELEVSQCGTIAERFGAFIDTNGDAFVIYINSYAAAQRAERIGTQISDLNFNNATNQLAGFKTGYLVVWTLPNVIFNDKKLLPATTINCGHGENIGKSATIASFVGNIITIRRSDGCVLAFYLSPYIAGVLRYVRASNWDRAVRICRTIKETYLWATLAGLAAAARNYTIAEICYGQLAEAEKVLYLEEIRNESNPQVRSALMALFNGRVADADTALVQSAQIFRAIMLNLALFKFDRALELALKHNIHLDTVLGYRLRYLEQTGRRETDPKFLKHLSQVEIDWPHIFEKVRSDRNKYEAQHS